MDFPSFWKDASIVLTGAFGILGFLKEFKNKETGKITVWGYISVAGILVCTIMGFAAQLIENSNDSKKAQDDATKALDASRQTQRLLSPVRVAKVKVTFKLPCDDDSFRRLCADIPENQYLLPDDQLSPLQTRLWSMVPAARSKTGVDLASTIALFKDASKADEYVTSGHKTPDADMTFLMIVNSLDKDNRLTLELASMQNNTKVPAISAFASQASNSGEIKSSLDINGSSAVVAYQSPLRAYSPEKFQPILVEIILDNDQIIPTSDITYRTAQDGSGAAVAHFPENASNPLP